MLNYKAVCPKSWKSGLIYCLLNRAWKVCSDRRLFDIETKKLFRIFSMNGYPKSFFDQVLSKFIQKQTIQTPNNDDDSDKNEFSMGYASHPRKVKANFPSFGGK